MKGKIPESIKHWDEIPIWNGKLAHHSKLVSCKSKTNKYNRKLFIQFVIPDVEEDIEIYTASPFNYYNSTGNETENERTCYMKYNGPENIMFNNSNNCTDEIRYYNIEDDIVTRQTCDTPNYSNLPRSGLWNQGSCTSQPINNPNFIQIRTIGYKNRIYCFPHKISINNQTQNCPNYVFEINRNEEFKIDEYEEITITEITTPLNDRQERKNVEILKRLGINETNSTLEKRVNKTTISTKKEESTKKSETYQITNNTKEERMKETTKTKTGEKEIDESIVAIALICLAVIMIIAILRKKKETTLTIADLKILSTKRITIKGNEPRNKRISYNRIKVLRNKSPKRTYN